MRIPISGAAYQTFDQAGASNSEAKLTAIRLPQDLAGKSFLDLGCNEGYFCIEARKRGASRVVGIDRNADVIARARARAPDIEFIQGPWTDLPNERFDVIVMLSALHYEERPREFLARLHDLLTDDGLLILEVGVANERGMTRVWTQRKSVVYHPTWDMLYERYLEPFAFRVVGRSVDQPGDPVPRWVVHCRRRKTNVVLITGASQYGKSTLARQLGAGRTVTIEVDAVLRRLLDTAKRSDTPLLEALEPFRDLGSRSFSRMIEAIVDAGLSDDFARILCEHIPLDETTVLIEGYGLRDDLLASLIRRLEGKAWVWTTERLSADNAAARLPRGAAEEVELLRWKLAQAQAANSAANGAKTPPVVDPEGLTGASAREFAQVVDERDELRAQLDRLSNRRSVRAALRLASIGRPVVRRIRR